MAVFYAVGSSRNSVAATSGAPKGATSLGGPMVLNAEGCADSDSDLRDAEYTCNDLRLRADWSGFALTDGEGRFAFRGLAEGRFGLFSEVFVAPEA